MIRLALYAYFAAEQLKIRFRVEGQSKQLLYARSFSLVINLMSVVVNRVERALDLESHLSPDILQRTDLQRASEIVR